MRKKSNSNIAIYLAKTFAIPSKDNGIEFTDDRRLKAIDKELESSAYKLVADEPLFKLYAAKELSELSDKLIVISTHVDCLQNSPVFEEKEKRLHGIFDNAITNAAVVAAVLQGKMPENVVLAFTGDEECLQRGAKGLDKYLRSVNKKYKTIVLDVTEEGWKGHCDFTIENAFLSSDELRKIRNIAESSGYSWKYIKDAWEDEAWTYDKLGIKCFSLCLPCFPENGEMHSQEGFDVRKKSYIRYIEMLRVFCKAF